MTRFYAGFRSAVVDYFEDRHPIGKVAIQDLVMKLPPELVRYPRAASFYAEYILPPEINSRIIWGATTAPDVQGYWKKREDRKFP